MNKQKKKGFTIVELVIVIAVIAILAAVLIPTFAGLIKKANMSSDEQAAREMNTALQAESVEAKPADLKDVIDILEEAGFDALALQPHTKGYEFYWCRVDNVILLVEVATETVKYPADKDLAEKFADHLDDGKAEVLKEGTKYINVEVTTDNIVEALQAGSDVTLTEDIVMTQTVDVTGDMTIDLNGYNLNGSGNTSRPLKMTNDANLVIQAGDKQVDCGAYGMVDVPVGTTGCSVTLEGGKYKATTDDGAFIKVRNNTEDVTVTLKDVNYVDSSNNGFLVSCSSDGLELLVDGGSYTSNFGFSVGGKTKFEGVTVNTNGAAFEVFGEAEIIDCVITTANATVGTAPAAGVAVCGGGTAKVTGCKINTSGVAFFVYSSGGTIIANNNTIGTCSELAKATLADNAPVDLARVTVNGKVVAEKTK